MQIVGIQHNLLPLETRAKLHKLTVGELILLYRKEFIKTPPWTHS